jgi:hypothetical protein
MSTPESRHDGATGSNHNQVELEVTYAADSTPAVIEYFHNTFGLMRFEVYGDTAVLESEWGRLGDGDLKEDFGRLITTGDVLYSVLNPPFIDTLDASKVIQKYDWTGSDTEQAKL